MTSASCGAGRLAGGIDLAFRGSLSLFGAPVLSLCQSPCRSSSLFPLASAGFPGD